MDGTLKLSDLTLAFGDPNTATSPQKKFVDWQVDVTAAVRNPKSEPYTIPAGESLQLFSGLRDIGADDTTKWAISLSSLAGDRYRFEYVPEESNPPALRTVRAMPGLGDMSANWTFNANLTATLEMPGNNVFGACQVEDILFVPGTSTGDPAGPFSSMNEGYWIILDISQDGTTVQLGRPDDVDFTAATEEVTATAECFEVYSPDGVQVGDSVNISAGFSSVVRRTYTVVAVNPNWFEVVTSSPLPIAATAIPGENGIQFFNAAKRYIEMYADQDCVLRLNGDESDSNRISPWQAGDINQAGRFVKCGPAWSALVVNKSQQDLNILLISAE